MNEEDTAWKGYTTGIGVVGSAPGCEGAIRWQCSQFFRVALMSADMPGQNTGDSTRAVIIDMPWWAACRVLSTSPRSEGGTITLSLYRITPSVGVMFRGTVDSRESSLASQSSTRGCRRWPFSPVCAYRRRSW